MGALSEDALAGIELVVDPLFGVNHLNLAEAVNGGKPRGLMLGQVVGESTEVVQQSSVLLDQLVIAGLEVGQEDVADTQAIAAGLVHVGRADAAQGRADFVLALFLLVGSVQQAVGRQNQMRLARDEQPLVHIDPMLFHLSNLALQRDRIDDDTVANQIELALPEDAARDGVQHMLASIKFEGMACIGATLEAGDDVVLRGQHVHNLSFPFIPPLEAQQNVDFHLC